MKARHLAQIETFWNAELDDHDNWRRLIRERPAAHPYRTPPSSPKALPMTAPEIIPASTHDHGVDIGDPPFMLPPTYPGLKGPRRTPRGISAIPPGAKAGTRFTSHLVCPRCGGTERIVGQTSDKLRAACLRCRRESQRESQRRRRANTRKGSDHG